MLNSLFLFVNTSIMNVISSWILHNELEINMIKYLKQLDWYIMVPYLLLSMIGIVMVFSSSEGLSAHTDMAFRYLVLQIVFVVVGFCVLIFFSVLRSKAFEGNLKFYIILMVIMVFALIFLMFFGATTNGAAGWIILGPVHIQPAEFCKPLFILYYANVLAYEKPFFENDGLPKEFITVARPSLIPIFMLLLILFQPDTGGFAINLFIILMMILAAGSNFKSARIWIVGIGALFVGFRLWIKPFEGIISHMHSYQMQRIISFSDPFKYIQTSGHQLVNSYYAISNGGWFGVGIGNGIQKIGYLSEPNTDFIIAVIGEELGIVGILVVLGLLLYLILRIIAVGSRTNDTFYSTICYGTAAYIFIQTLFNTGGAIGMIPLTGVALPFISYGGSSIIALTICLGLVLHISRIEKKERNKKS